MNDIPVSTVEIFKFLRKKIYEPSSDAPVDSYWTDPYTAGWTCTSPFILILVVGSYLGFHLLYGSFTPQERENLPPNYRRRWTVAKNWILFVFNSYLAYALYSAFQGLEYNWFCEPVRRVGRKTSLVDWAQDKEDPRVKAENHVSDLLFWFWISRIFECLDTVSQSIRGEPCREWAFYHHISLVIVVWLGLVFAPGGTGALCACLNCICHTPIYGSFLLNYYLPDPDNTTLKMNNFLNKAQLLVVFGMCVSAIYYNCGFPLFAAVIVLLFDAGMLFSWFFLNR